LVPLGWQRGSALVQADRAFNTNNKGRQPISAFEPVEYPSSKHHTLPPPSISVQTVVALGK